MTARAAAAAAVVAALLTAAAGAGAGEPIAANEATVRDFLIQNICLDSAGAVLPGRSPLDGAAACPAQRDLRPGDPLPYHKHDHPSPDQRGGAPLGYQRHDSFPVDTAGLGVVVELSFDFGAGEGRRFGRFDPGRDGGDIAIVSPGAASIGATEDASGLQLFVGECQGAVSAAALTRSWILAEFGAGGAAPLAGETIARLNDLKKGRQQSCPARFNPAFTRWRVEPFRYRAAPGQGAPIVLESLISEHFGGAAPATADHVERFYFTRELGGTRWERWQNASGNSVWSAARIRAMATWFAGTGRCSAPAPPEGDAPMLLIDCREWTRIVPPANPAGDPAGFFLDDLRARADAPAFFAAPVEHK